MYRVRSVALAVLVLSATTLPVVAQDQTFPATIVLGDCASEAVAAELTDLVLPGGSSIGAAAGRTAASSFTTAPIAFNLLTESPHAIRAGESCGAIGGSINAAGALIVVLSGAGGDSGIAYLSPSTADAALTDVSLFLAPPTQDGAEVAQATTQDNIEANATEVNAEPTAIPEPTPTPVAVGHSADNPALVGTTLEHEGLAVTIDSAYYDFVFANAIPRGGFKLLIMQVTITNVGDSTERYDAASFSGRDADTGNSYNAVTLDDVGVLLRDGSLDPGAYVTGTAILEVQETAARVIVTYDPQAFDTNDLYWIVQ